MNAAQRTARLSNLTRNAQQQRVVGAAIESFETLPTPLGSGVSEAVATAWNALYDAQAALRAEREALRGEDAPAVARPAEFRDCDAECGWGHPTRDGHTGAKGCVLADAPVL